MNIVLIGYRGTGKSTIAKILSARLKWPRFNLDEAIVKDRGMSIPQIVEKHGWEFFRDVESRMVGKTSAMDRTIIDAGGGIIVRHNNVDILRTKGFIIWLKARPETIIRRIKDNKNRPSLTGNKSFLEEIQEVLAERTPKYQAAAHVAIDTDDLSPQDVAKKIIEEFNRFNAG